MWKKLINEKRIVTIFWVLCALFFIVLFAISFLASGITPDVTDETVHFVQDNILGNVLGLAIALGLGMASIWFYKKFLTKYNMDICAVVFCVIIWFISVYWIFAAKSMPGADQASLWAEAMKLEQGDISGFGQGGYLTRCPQQLGLVTLIRVIIKIFGLENYKAIEYSFSFAIPVLVFAGYQVVKRLTNDQKVTEWIYLITMLLCVPLYGYAPFVYGEIISTMFVMLAAWFLLDATKEFNWKKTIATSLCLGLAVLFRQNALIFLIAFEVVLVVKMLVRFTWKYVATALTCLIGVLLIQFSMTAFYSPYMEEGNEAIPAILYITMGTRDTLPEKPGWYDGYNHSVYFDVDCDADAAREIAYADLQAFIEKCTEDPAYAVDFYQRKFTTQWNVPMYLCLVMTNKIVEEQIPFAESVYFGEASKWMDGFANIYQLVIYGGVLFLLYKTRKQWNSIERYALLIGVYGGFLFSMIWEAKSRYVFPYMLVMIPYAACGVSNLIEQLRGWYYRKKIMF